MSSALSLTSVFKPSKKKISKKPAKVQLYLHIQFRFTVSSQVICMMNFQFLGRIKIPVRRLSYDWFCFSKFYIPEWFLTNFSGQSVAR